MRWFSNTILHFTIALVLVSTIQTQKIDHSSGSTFSKENSFVTLQKNIHNVIKNYLQIWNQ